MSDIKTKLKVYDTNNRIDYELYEDYTRFKSLNLKITKAIGSNTLIVDLPCKDSGWQTWRYLYTTPHNLYGLRGLFLDQVDIDDCTTLSRDLEDWILTRMTRHES